MNYYNNLVAVAVSLLSATNLSGCTESKAFLASSASSTSLSSLSSSSVSSHSSWSISDSSESASESSSTSSPEQEGYVIDVAELTSAYVSSAPVQSDYPAFLNGISEIAKRNGVINWENNSNTFFGFGKGLKRAQLSPTRYAAYKQLLGDSDYAKMQDIDRGYASE